MNDSSITLAGVGQLLASKNHRLEDFFNSGRMREGVQSINAIPVVIKNEGTTATGIIRTGFLNENRSAIPDDFAQRSNSCVGRPLAAGATCQIDVVFISAGYGGHRGWLQVSADGGNTLNVELKGEAVLP